MTRRDYELEARLDDSQILAALRRIDANIDKIAKNGSRAFDGMARGGKQSAVSLGAVTGVVTSITTKLIEAGEAAARFFATMLKDSVQAAQGLETVEASLTGIFEGNEQAAIAVLQRIREESVRLGVDIAELAPAFLPKVEDLDQFTRIAELAAGLARIDPAQGAQGARIALTEALGGDPKSLRRRFEIDITPIEEAQKELGEVEGLLVGLQQVLEERGQDFESLSDTALATFNQSKQIVEDFKGTLGEPILDELKEDFQALNQFILDNKDSIDLIAGAIGDTIAQIADLSGDGLLAFAEGLDPERILEFIAGIQETISLIEALREVSADNPVRELRDGVLESLDPLFDLQTALTALIQIGGIVNATLAGTIAVLGGISNIAQRLAGGQITDLNAEIAALGEVGRQAAAEAIQGASDALANHSQRVDDFTEGLEERRIAQEKSTDADLAAANAILANKAALQQEASAQDDSAKAAEQAAAAQQKLTEQREKLAIDRQRAEFDLALKHQRALIDAEIEFAQKREDIARENRQKIEDIYRKNNNKITEAAIDLRRDEEDIARDHARDIAEVERESADEKIQIEVDYRRELERIRARFDFDAQEAIRANDAIAFLRIQRRKDFELQQAKEQHNEEIQDAEQAAIERREALQIQLQQEIEDARIANARKLEDLRLSLAQELEAQRINYQRDIEEAVIAEERKREELKRTFERERADLQREWDRKLADLERNYQREIELIRRYEAQKARIQAQARANARRRITGDPARSGTNNNEGDGFIRETPGGRTAIARKDGGYTPSGMDVLVGEKGPEIVRLPRPGYVIPTHQLKFNPAVAGNTTNISSRTTNLNLDAMLNTLSPHQVAIVTELVNQLNLEAQ